MYVRCGTALSSRRICPLMWLMCAVSPVDALVLLPSLPGKEVIRRVRLRSSSRICSRTHALPGRLRTRVRTCRRRLMRCVGRIRRVLVVLRIVVRRNLKRRLCWCRRRVIRCRVSRCRRLLFTCATRPAFVRMARMTVRRRPLACALPMT